ncbi:MAG: trans-aconitate 2-methyltransferase, partial [Rhodomicrobium sp.]
MSWSPEQYTKFEDERTRPARDLLQAVSTVRVKAAADLGCGPGNSTELIAARFTDASIVGVDNSPEMIEAARKRLPDIQFQLCGIEEWSEPGPWGLIYANAALQWVPNHQRLLPALVSGLAPGGTLAVQMPDNLQEPSHTAMRTIALQKQFIAKLADAVEARTKLGSADWYYSLLRPLCSRVDVWRTTYFHPLSGGIDAIVEWVKGTALMPYLNPLSETEREAFVAAYKDELAKAYTVMDSGTV